MGDNRVKLIQCTNCPARGKLVECPAIAVGHKRFCEWVDPASPKYRPDGASVVMRTARRFDIQKNPAFIPTPAEQSEWVDTGPDASEIPGPDSGRDDSPSSAASQSWILPDDKEHERVYEAAMSCEHRTETESCCGGKAIRCGKNGSHAGSVARIALCYPCSTLRLGIRTAVPGA